MAEVELVGRVGALYLYPVKSMRGTEVEQVELNWLGFHGDRKYGFVQSESRSSFPWLTARQWPEMVRCEAFFADPSDPESSAVRVRRSDGLECDVEDPSLGSWLSEQSGYANYLLHLQRGTFDRAPVSVITRHTIQVLSRVLGYALDERRFRPNVLLDMEGGAVSSFPEDGWLGHELVFGDVNDPDATSVKLSQPTRRCKIITIDPDSSSCDPDVLRTVSEVHESRAGLDALPHREGTIRVGDAVHLVRRRG